MSSCQLQDFASIRSLSNVSSYLFGDTQTDDDGITKDEDERWDSDEWTKNWDFDSPVTEDALQEENEWIQNCCFSYSPAGDFLCLAHGEKTVFLSAQNFGKDSKGELDVCYKGILAEEEGERITCVLCIPLISLSRTSHGRCDWTCTLVGFSSGYVRMYTEAGGLLLSELLHESAVVQLNCRTFDTTFNTTYNGSADHRDELTILYGHALVSIDGFSLFQTLRACRNQLAVATAHGTKVIDPPPLSYKKWVLRGQERITSHLSVGLRTHSPFDQMHAASTQNGFSADIKSATASMSQYVTAGSSPFVGFYYAIEGSAPPFLSHVALAVASKLKSALVNAASGWLGWGQKAPSDEASKPKPKIEIGTALDIHCGLPDLLRNATDVILAPGINWLAATSDSFGRVMLLDLNKTRALRMWKGYRDAQIGFIQTNDTEVTNKGPRSVTRQVVSRRRMALFLVIYAPRRGILEVWSCINGPRVGTFNIGKNAKLVYPGYGMFGLNHKQDTGKTGTYTLQSCVLESNGEIKEIAIPFHLALSDSNSSKARDIHLLKTINHLLQKDVKDGSEFIKLITSMRLPSVQLQAVKKLLQTSNVECDVFKKCLDEIGRQLTGEAGAKKEEKELLNYIKAQNALLDLYLAMQKLNTSATECETQTLEDATGDGLSKELIMSTAEASTTIEVILDFRNAGCISKITERNTLKISDFLRCFNVDLNDRCQHNLASNSTAMTKLLGEHLFHSSLFSGVSPDDVIDTIKRTIAISNRDILYLVFECWKANEDTVASGLLASLQCLKKYVETLTEHDAPDNNDETKENVCDDDGFIANWRDCIYRDVCFPSKSVLSAYLIILVCRTVDVSRRTAKVDLEQQVANDVKGNGDPPTYEEVVHGVKAASTGWETLWPELENWYVVMKQYEDCLAVNTALSMANKELPVVDGEEKEREIRVSVNDLLHNGPGYIPELLAVKICSLDLPAPSLLVVRHPVTDGDGQSDACDDFAQYLRSKLVGRFPNLLSSNSVHSHCFWQEMVLWNKDPEVISRLEKSVTHIRLVLCDPHLQHGLTLMAWRTFIAKRFHALAKLVDKVGKAPKDRLCRKETDMSVNVLAIFCQCCTQLLQVIADADPDQFPKPPVDQIYEKSSALSVLDDTWSEVEGKESITDMGRDQPTANFALVQHAMHLSFVLNGTMEFTLRGVKPLTQLFNSNSRKNFFVDLTTSHIHAPHTNIIDADISNHRKQFLFKLVRAAVKKIYLEKSNDDLKENMKEWIETSVHMGAEFMIDDSLIRIHYICELIKFGLDSMAYDILKTTGNDKQLGSNLIALIGKRLHHILISASPEDGVIILAQMSTTLSSWIRAQNPKELDVADVPARDTLFLAQEIPLLLREEHEQYALSEFVIEALQVVVNS